jgi:hypothetical protein
VTQQNGMVYIYIYVYVYVLIDASLPHDVVYMANCRHWVLCIFLHVEVMMITSLSLQQQSYVVIAPPIDMRLDNTTCHSIHLIAINVHINENYFYVFTSPLLNFTHYKKKFLKWSCCFSLCIYACILEEDIFFYITIQTAIFNENGIF